MAGVRHVSGVFYGSEMAGVRHVSGVFYGSEMAGVRHVWSAVLYGSET